MLSTTSCGYDKPRRVAVLTYLSVLSSLMSVIWLTYHQVGTSAMDPTEHQIYPVDSWKALRLELSNGVMQGYQISQEVFLVMLWDG